MTLPCERITLVILTPYSKSAGVRNDWQKRKRLAVRLAVESLLFQVAPTYCDPQRLAARPGIRGLASANPRRLSNLDRGRRSSTVARPRDRRVQPHTTVFDPAHPARAGASGPTAIVQSITSSPGTVAVATVQSVLVHAHPADGGAVGGAEELRNRLRVPGRRRGTPTPVPRPTGRRPPATPRPRHEPRPSRPVRPARPRSGRAAA